jgi:hypothetical protein
MKTRNRGRSTAIKKGNPVERSNSKSSHSGSEDFASEVSEAPKKRRRKATKKPKKDVKSKSDDDADDANTENDEELHGIIRIGVGGILNDGRYYVRDYSINKSVINNSKLIQRYLSVQFQKYLLFYLFRLH